MTYKFIFPLTVILLCLFLYAGARKFLAQREAGLLCILFLYMPVIWQWGGTGYMDVPFAAFYCAAVVSVLNWLERGKAGDLYGAAVFSAATAFTKNEGVSVVFLLAFLISGWSLLQRRKKPILDVLTFSLIVSALLLPWLLFRLGIPNWDSDYRNRFLLPTFVNNANRIPVIFSEIFQLMFASNRFNGLWHILLIFAGILLLRQTKNKGISFLWLLLTGHIGLYVIAYTLLPLPPEALIPHTLDRLLIHVSPIAILIIARQWGDLLTDAPLGVTIDPLLTSRREAERTPIGDHEPN